MAALIGVIHNISTPRAMLDLCVYDDGILVGRGSIKTALILGAAAGTGSASIMRRAMAVAGKAEERRTAAGAAVPREDLLRAHAANRFIPTGDIASAVLKRGWFGNCRLTLELRNGTSEKLPWKRAYNDPDVATAILKAGLGPLLAT